MRSARIWCRSTAGENGANAGATDSVSPLSTIWGGTSPRTTATKPVTTSPVTSPIPNKTTSISNSVNPRVTRRMVYSR